MAPQAHALLGASSAHRWLTCTPSARLEEAQGEPDRGSVYADEGTAAHEYAEILLSHRLNKINNRSFSGRMKKVKAGQFWGPEMEEAINDYADYVLETVEGCRMLDPEVYVDLEQRVDYSAYVPEGFGTADVCVIADGTLHVIDLKYGKGVAAPLRPGRGAQVPGALRLQGRGHDHHAAALGVRLHRRLDAGRASHVGRDRGAACGGAGL